MMLLCRKKRSELSKTLVEEKWDLSFSNTESMYGPGFRTLTPPGTPRGYLATLG